MTRTELPIAENVMAKLDKISGFQPKVVQNTASGLVAYGNGEVSIWPGFNHELFSRKITILAEFDERSADEIKRRVTKPLQDLATKYGITLSSAMNGDLPPHLTVQFPHFPEGIESEGKDKGLVTEKTQEIVGAIADDSQSLVGSIVPFDRLVLAGSQIYMCIGRPTKDEKTFKQYWDMLEAREKINAVLDRESALENPKYDDIIHSVIGRITAINDDVDPRKLSEFAAEAYTTVGQDLAETPISARIGSIYVGPINDYVNRVNPHLLHRTK